MLITKSQLPVSGQSMSALSFQLWTDGRLPSIVTRQHVSVQHGTNGRFLHRYIKGFPIRGFILVYKKNACFMWKIIWFFFHSIAEGLPLIMENNVIHMAFTVMLTGPCSFHEIFHYIFAHLRLYFVDNGTNLLFEFLNWLTNISINLIFHLTPKKKV